MNRRTFLCGLTLGILSAPRGAAAQPAGSQPTAKVYRIGILIPGSTGPSFVGFEAGLQQRGWLPGHNVVLEYRFAHGDLQQLPALAAELVRLPADLLLVSSVAIPAARAATRTIPIVMAFAVDDPVEEGWVTNLARPDGNITGMTLYAPELTAKRLELLKAVLPGVRRVGVLAWHRPGGLGQLKAVETAAPSLGLRHYVIEANDAAQYDPAFQALKREGADAALVLSSSAFFAARQRIANLALRHRLPLISPFREMAEAGGLVAYGPNVIELWRDRVPTYVDRILKGAKPGDIPVEQPTKLELVINLKTASALGLTIPPALLLRADRVIE